ncbi:hypothetical protein CRG98_006583 [Punica granatum]|uniref:Uncharacterized protein n=1 Tax=Punica granatum TaxID=22663 RepID=A0A2I0KX31_PUNGR|nr:hypothetical protein CRG98_006583 [Punica granatum]
MEMVLTTTAFELECTSRRSWARLMDINPALHPIPDRLKLLMLLLSLYLLTTIADKEGVGEKRLQLTMRMSMSLAFKPVCLKSESRAEEITISASRLAASKVGVGGI